MDPETFRTYPFKLLILKESAHSLSKTQFNLKSPIDKNKHLPHNGMAGIINGFIVSWS